MKVKVKSLSRVRLFANLWTVAHQAPLSLGFSRQEYWSGLPFPSPGDLPNPGIEPGSPALQADSLPSEPPGKHSFVDAVSKVTIFRSSPEPLLPSTSVLVRGDGSQEAWDTGAGGRHCSRHAHECRCFTLVNLPAREGETSRQQETSRGSLLESLMR